MELKSGSMESLQYAAGSLKADSVVKSGAPAPRSKDELAAKKVAREFEGLFVGMMLKSMRDTVGKDSITGGGQGEEMFHSMLDQEYARIITEHGGIGMSTMLDTTDYCSDIRSQHSCWRCKRYKKGRRNEGYRREV